MEKFEDVRGKLYEYYPNEFQKNINFVNETPSLDILKTLSFNEDTEWTDNTLPKKILEHGKIPPLGIKHIHEQGIDGKGVNIAIIDQPLALAHPEYKGKIKEYKVFMPENYKYNISSMHGPAVTSLLVGENVGVAPKAMVYYAACPSWLRDAQYEANALEWILDMNKNLSNEQKIKFVSVSAAPGEKMMREKNSAMWMDAVKKAETNGVVVVECTKDCRFVRPGYIDYETEQFQYGFPNQPCCALNEKRVDLRKGEIFVPNSLRTFAESYDNKNFSYQYNGQGGLSWGIPFAAGVLALGQQVNKNLSAFQLKSLLINTSENNKGIIAPSQFINALELLKDNELKKL